jgi:hypothetical protein
MTRALTYINIKAYHQWWAWIEVIAFSFWLVCKRTSGWKEKFLSLGGKEVFLKVMAQAIPSYAISVLKILQKKSKGIIATMFNYCWEDGANQKKIHWSAW